MEEPLLPSVTPSDELDQRVSKRCNSFSLFSRHKKPSRVGAALQNLGNTCFLNAVLQCITHTIPLAEKICLAKHSLPCPEDDGDEGFCSFCAFKEHIEKSIKGSGSVICPEKFKDNLSKISSDFVAGEQADAHEFLRCFLDNLDSSSLNSGIKGNNKPSIEEKSIVKQVFGGCLKSQLRCGECGHCSDTFEPFLDLSLEIDSDSVETLPDALCSFTQVEAIEDPDIKFTCEGCKAQVSKMEKQLRLDELPQVLALHLKRFKNDGVSIDKIDKFVQYPVELDLNPFLSGTENEEMKYELYGIVEHKGAFYYGGHYVCTVRSSPTSWHLFDDSQVTSISESAALQQTAYILFYIKKGTSPWFSTLIRETDSLSLVDETSDGSPVSVLQSLGRDWIISTLSDEEFSPVGNKPTPILHMKEKEDEPSVPRPCTPPRPVTTNLVELFDIEDLPEDKEEAQFVPQALMETVRRKRLNKGMEEKLEKESASLPPPVNLSNPANPAKPTEKPVDKSVKRSLSLMTNSKRRNVLLQYLPTCPETAKRRRVV